MQKKPSRKRRIIAEPLESRLLFSATADFALLDDGHSDVDYLTQTAYNTDLTQVFDLGSDEISLQPDPTESDSAYLNDDDITDYSGKNLIFVDTSVENYQTLIDDIKAEAASTEFETVLIDADENGIDKISSTLAQLAGVGAIHVISHGSEGRLQLGTSRLDNETIKQFEIDIASWGNALGEDADILIYGCDLAANDDGIQLLDEIGRLTNADVAASDDSTGSAELGGDWILEVNRGEINTRTLFNDSQQQNWQGLLAGDIPVAANDAINVWFNETIEANVITGAGGTNILADNLGADGPGTITSVTYNSTLYDTFDGSNNLNIATASGTFVINRDGTFTFDTSATATVANPLSEQSWEDVFDLYGYSAGTAFDDGFGNLLLGNSNTTVNEGGAGLGIIADGVDRLDSNAGNSEAIVVNLLGSYQTVEVTTTNHNSTEIAAWTAYDAGGNEVDSGTFTGFAGGGASDYHQELITPSGAFQYIVFSVPVSGESYNVYEISAGPSAPAAEVFDYVVEDSNGDSDTGQLTISYLNDNADPANGTAVGTATENSTLSASFNDNDGVSGSINYQWQRSADGSTGWTNITGATNSTYTLDDADVGNYVRFSASYVDNEGTHDTAYSYSTIQITGVNDTATIAISGTTTEDQTLTANITDGDGFSGETYQWQRSADGSSGWANISGATGSTYTLTDADVGQYVRVSASFTDDGGSAEAPVSSASAQIVNVNDTSSISLSGTQIEDQTLTASITDADGFSGVTYQWQRSADGVGGWANISGATNSTYTLTDTDVGQYVRVTASYTDDNGTAETPVSPASGQIANINDTSSISFTGTETEDQTLTASITDADGFSSVTYQWQRSVDGSTGWTNIAGATNSTYTLTDTDVGQYVRVTATYTDDNGTAETPVSTASGQIANVNDASSISFTGTETEDQTLTANITDADGFSAIAYQWQRSADGSTGWTNIAGATNSTYTLTDTDVGQYIRVSASYTDDNGTAETPVSSASGQIANVNDASSISFTGTETEDQTLTASITDADGFSSVAYQWQRSADGSTGWTNIAGATNSTYTLTDTDVGQYVRVTATYTDNNGTAETPVSSASGQIANVNDTSSISFTGTETEDQTLTANITDADGFSSVTYQWQRSADGSTGWANIAGATNSTYTLTDADVSQYVRITASYTDDNGTAETPVSSSSGQITNVNDASSISFTGTETEDQTLTASITDADGFSSVTHQWQRSADGSTGWTNISGATSSTYTLTDTDVGQYVRVTATYTDDNGTAETPVSSASGQIANINDSSSISFTGTEIEDQTLAANITDADGFSSVTYQWQRSVDGSTGWANISGATNATYTLTDTDVGQYVRVTASYTDDNGTAETPISTASGQIANTNDASSISFSGTQIEDQTLTASITDADGYSAVTYQWQRSADGSTGWTNISGATSSTYTLTDTDVGQYVRVTASYTDDNGTAETPVSSASGQITNTNDPSSISFTGTETENQTLTASITDTDGFSGVTYQWQRSADGSTGWTNITGATNSTYTLTDSDVSQYVRVTASYTDDNGTAETPVSSASGQIANVNDTSSISFSGTETEDQTLTANITDADGFSGVTYQWQRSADGSTGWSNIAGATSSSYTLTDSDVGQYVRVTASYTDDNGTSETPVSSASGQIANVNDTSSISFTGTETENQTLTASVTDADGFSVVTYQWQRSADGSTGWANISGATSSTYTLTGTDVGQHVRVMASYTDDNGTAETPVSSASGQIANVNDPSSISFSGTETEDQTLTASITDADGFSSVSYQWQRSTDGSTGWSNIAGATSSTYTLTDSDVSQYVRVTASYTDDNGTTETPVSSASGQIANVNDTSSISFTGTETENQTLTASIIDADGFSGVTYQWQRSADGSTGWTNITGATNSTYALADTDVGQYVRVTASYTDDNGTAETPVSSASAQITNVNDASSISFTGTETEDQTLTASITDADGFSAVTYQWQRSADGSTGWTNISGATSSTYTLTDTDVGQYVRVTASYTDDNGTAETPVSTASGQIGNANDPSSISFAGTETEDQTLTASITDADGFSSVTYQWQRSANGSTGWTNIAGATNSTYTLTDADVDQYVRVTATYTDDNGTAETPVSNSSGPINNINDDPILANPLADQVIDEDSLFSFAVPGNTFTDADGDTLIYNARLVSGNPLPAWLNFDVTTQVFTGTPDAADIGTLAIEVTATDGNGGVGALDTFNLVVNSVNDQPTAFGIADFSVNEDTTNSQLDIFTAFDDEEDADNALSYQVISNSNTTLVSNINLDTTTGQLQLDYSANQFGSSTITLRATDSQGASIDSSFTVTVTPVNDNPTASNIPDISFLQGTRSDSALTLGDIFNDLEDGTNLTFSVQSNSNPALTQAIAIDSQTGELVLSYNPQASGQATIVLRATDSMGAWVETEFNVLITANPEPSVPEPSVPEPPVPVPPQEPDEEPENPVPVEEPPKTPEPIGPVEPEPNLPGDSNNLDENIVDESQLVGLASNLGSAPASFSFDQANEYRDTQEHKRKIAESRPSENSVQTGSNLASLVALDNIYISEQDITDFNNELRKLKNDIDEAIEEENTQRAIFAGITISITTGIVVWALRAGSLFLTLFSILPLWKGFDPLPVLNRESRRKDLEKQKQDKQEEDRQHREVGYLFDNNPNDSRSG